MTIKKLKLLLPHVIYINWFGYDWYIKKNQNRNFYWQKKGEIN